MKELEKLRKAMESAAAILKELAKPLTTKQRNEMKETSFCGPSKSFPVSDCVRAVSAKVYLNRSNFSDSVKSKIAACINRKSKMLGCKKGKPAKVEAGLETAFDDINLTPEEIQEIENYLNSEAFASTLELCSKDNAEQLMQEFIAANEDCCKGV